MFHLTKAELDNAFSAINHHGYSAMLPPPIEWEAVKTNWEKVRDSIISLDLDSYEPYKLLKVFAPKNRANIRVVHLLHPQDLIIYTALTLIVKDAIEDNRLPKRSKSVFSYRINKDVGDVLYESKGDHDKYLTQLSKKSKQKKNRFVAIADIADFFPSIYQHRLENVIEVVSTTQRGADVARVLVKKLISKLMSRNSYGIPVGPYASRVLAEAVLIDVDSYLHSRNVDFVRWVDDYNIFCKTEYDAQSTVFSLGEWLYEHHGLILQSAKTKILTSDRFDNEILSHPKEKPEQRDVAIEILREITFDPYADFDDENQDEFNEEEIQELLRQLQAVNLVSMLKSSISDSTLVDFEIIKYILTRLPKLSDPESKLNQGVLELTIKHAELLYPLSEQIAKYVLSFENLPNKDKKKISKKLLKPLLGKHPPPDYYAMWMLHIFSTSADWNHLTDIVRIYQQSSSHVVKRYAALAIAKGGSRADSLIVKDDLSNAPDLLRLAILEASSNLGKDERKHWKLANQINGIIEKII